MYVVEVPIEGTGEVQWQGGKAGGQGRGRMTGAKAG